MRRPPALHPVLLATYPVLVLFSDNLWLLSSRDLPRAAAVTICISASLWLTSAWVLKNARRGALLTSMLLGLAFAYEHLLRACQWLAGSTVFTAPGTRPLAQQATEGCALLLWAATAALVTVACSRARRSFDHLTPAIDAAALVLIALPLVRIASYDPPIPRSAAAHPIPVTATGAPGRHPDIYYIVLDEYGRADVLAELFDHDNAPFLDRLRQKGFFVAGRSRANYSQTRMSLASALNFTYLERPADGRQLVGMIRDSRIVAFLEARGYDIVTFDSGMALTRLGSADRIFSPPGCLTEFETVLLNKTPLPALRPLLRDVPWAGDLLGDPYDAHRRRLRYVFDHLADAAGSRQPVFVFAHIMAPHPPFVVGENGKPIRAAQQFSFLRHEYDEAEYVRGYREALAFINAQLERALDSILERSVIPPIIMLQGDHGSGALLRSRSFHAARGEERAAIMHERLAILSAYHLPGQHPDVPYDRITPVNSFRLVLRRYFGADLELLDDQSYFAPYKPPFSLLEVVEDAA